MSDAPKKRRVRRLTWIAAGLLLLLGAMLGAPFLLTSQLMRLALGHVFPANRPNVGRAALSPSRTLVLHDLVLQDTGTLAQQPLVTARQVDVAFGWTALLARQIHRIHAPEVTVYARSNGPAPLLPDMPGPLVTTLAALDVSGMPGSGTGDALGSSGNIRLQDLSVPSPAGGTLAFALERLTAAGSVEVQLDRWIPAAFKVRDGMMQWATLRYRHTAVNNLEASWRIDGQQLLIDRFAAQLFDGHIRGSLTWDLSTHAMPRCEVQIQRINMHAALANISPEHLDAEGTASGVLHLVLSEEGELSGDVDLAFDGPGLLRVGEIEEVREMLVGNVGLGLASLALQDLQQYPFKEGKLHLESVGRNSQLQITFVRQPRSATDVRPPHKEIINGQEVWVGSLVVPTIDMTVPITGTSLAEILSIVSGVRPRNEAAGEQPGK